MLLGLMVAARALASVPADALGLASSVCVATIHFFLAAAGSALADSPDCPFPLRAALPEFQGKPVEVDRGASLTKSARHEGLKVQFQEGRRETNWTQLSTDGSELLNGPAGTTAPPVSTGPRSLPPLPRLARAARASP